MSPASRPARTAPKSTTASKSGMATSRLYQRYQQQVAPALQQEFGYTNRHQIPTVTKIVVNAGVGRATADEKHLEQASATIAKITGQQPVPTVAKKSVAAFKLREGQRIGTMVTLRGRRMYDFLDRLISVALPRVRDFHGVSATAFDPSGNYSLGIAEQTIFPEISFEEAGVNHSLQINVITSAQQPNEARRLLELLGLPFERSN